MSAGPDISAGSGWRFIHLHPNKVVAPGLDPGGLVEASALAMSGKPRKSVVVGLRAP